MWNDLAWYQIHACTAYSVQQLWSYEATRLEFRDDCAEFPLFLYVYMISTILIYVWFLLFLFIYMISTVLIYVYDFYFSLYVYDFYYSYICMISTFPIYIYDFYYSYIFIWFLLFLYMYMISTILIYVYDFYRSYIRIWFLLFLYTYIISATLNCFLFLPNNHLVSHVKGYIFRHILWISSRLWTQIYKTQHILRYIGCPTKHDSWCTVSANTIRISHSTFGHCTL